MNRLLLNTGSNVLLLFARLVITFVMTPITVHSLGNYDYGIWEMVVAVTGYMGMLDLGLTPTISRFTAKFNAENDKKGLERLLATGTVALGALGSLILVAFVVWAWFRPDLLAAKGGEDSRYAIFLVLIGLQTAIAFPGHVAEAALEGLQRYSAKNIVTLASVVFGAVATYIFITPQNALLLLALVNGIGSTVKYAIFFWMLMVGSEPRLRVTLRQYSAEVLKTITQFGAKSFIQGAAGNLESNTPVLVIGAILGPAAVVFYRLPVALVSQLRMLSWTLTHAFMPLFSDLSARGSAHETRMIYLNASKILLGLLLPAAVMLGLLGSDFIGVWMGADYGAKASGLVWWVIAFYMLPSIDPLASRYLTAIGRHGVFARLYPIQALANIAISVPLAYAFGILGVVIGSVLPTAVITPLVLRTVCGEVGFSVGSYLRHTIGPALVPLAAMTTCALVAKHWIAGIHGYADLLYVAAASGAAYLSTYFLWGLSPAERRELISHAPWLRARAG